MKKFNMILTERLKKNQSYHQKKLKIPQELANQEYLTGEEILPFDQKQITVQNKSNYSPLGEVFEKLTETVQGSRRQTS